MKVMTSEQLNSLLQEFRLGLEEIFGERLQGAYLYGSYARQEADEDSDIDVAVILKGPVDSFEETKRIGEFRASLCLRDTCLIMPVFLSDHEWSEQEEPLCQSVTLEGLLI